MTLDQQLQSGLAHHQTGRLAEAEKIYRQILAQNPDHADALHLLGVLIGQAGRLDLAEDYFRRAIRIRPDFAYAHNNLGNALKARGQVNEAIACFRHAISLKPDLAEAHNNLGNALQQIGRIAEAIAANRRALQIRPDYAEGHCNLGNALRADGQIEEAIAAYRLALRLKPDLAEIHSNLGNILSETGQLNEAVGFHQQAIRLRPDLAEAHSNYGNALAAMERREEALAAFAQAIRLNPRNAKAYCNLANTLKKVQQNDQAIATFQKALEIDPELVEARVNLASALKNAGRFDDAIAELREVIRRKPRYAVAASDLILVLLYHPDYTAEMIRDELRRWNEQCCVPFRKLIQPHANDRDPDRRLRIGYVSPDFREHVVGRNVLPLFREHDHDRFEIFCYSNVGHEDALTERFRGHADHWRRITGHPDAHAVDLIRKDRIDILVDLSLHTGGNRLPIFAHKPAPVQATFAGYPGSTGLETIDYRLTDPYLDPVGSSDQQYCETSIRLPHSFWCFDPLSVNLPVNPLPAQNLGDVTFGCLNNFFKVNPGVLRLWARVLRSVDRSRLIILCPEGSHRQSLMDLMQREGISADRIDLISRCARPKYFELYHRIDLGLDTIPYNGHTTSLDSYWMGVPVVTLVGKTVVGRAGLSQLTNLGLTELIAETPEQYVEIAVGVARDLPRLAELRRTLRDRMRTSPLMDAARFTRDIENAYRQMWRNWCSSNRSR
jgi:protein O-GlcNAc transferase